jgi:hypothetical protein
MSKAVRITLITIGSIIGVFLIALIAGNLIVKNKVENFVNHKLPEHISATYKNLDVHLFTGTMTFSEVQVSLQNKMDQKQHTKVTSNQLIVEGFKYWDYLFKNKIHLAAIKTKSPEVSYHQNLFNPSDSTNTSKDQGVALNKAVLVDKLSIDQAKISIFDNTQDSTLLHVPSISVTVDSLGFDSETLKNRLPVTYSNYQATADSVFLKVSPFENLKTGPLTIKDRQATVNSIRLATKYSIPKHTKLLEKERDHFDVTLASLNIQNIDFGFSGRQFYSSCTKIILDKVDATIYRNKLVADDNTTKPLYSKMLRELPIALTVDSLLINKSAIRYEEKVNAEQPPGAIYFENLEAVIENLGNTYPKEQQTNIKVTSKFMNSTPVSIDWNFDVNDTNDAFTFKADLETLEAEELNSFTKPNLLAELEGTVDQTYLSIYGNSNQSEIDMRIKFDNFKVDLLEDNRKNEKTLLSGIVNLFVKNDSKGDSQGFTKGNASVQPDKTKSFFNYLWLNIRAGLKACLL